MMPFPACIFVLNRRRPWTGSTEAIGAKLPKCREPVGIKLTHYPILRDFAGVSKPWLSVGLSVTLDSGRPHGKALRPREAAHDESKANDYKNCS